MDAHDPARLAAILSIHVLDAVGRKIWPTVFEQRLNRNQLETLARTLSGDPDLALEPYMPYLVQVIVGHFRAVSQESPLPTEREIVEWIEEKGGISTLLLQRMAWGYRLRW